MDVVRGPGGGDLFFARCSTWRSIGGRRGPQESKNLVRRCSTWRSIGGLREPQKSKNEGATWSTAITAATGITRSKILESRLKTGDLGKVALLFGVTTENSAVSSSSVAKFGPEEHLQQFRAR
ncbi:uncharacterized protein LOC144154928 isoform X3 [Haemaphysalis longicornis]